MSNLVKLEFNALDITGNNYMRWTVDVEMYLESMNLIETLQEVNESSKMDKAKSLIFLRRHIDESLKNEYLTMKDPRELWKNLKDRFDHQRDVMLPTFRDEWNTLRFQDFKKVIEYNSAMFRIVTHLKFCGVTITEADMLEKTFSTFHASNVTLQQQYRVQNFRKYSELINCLLVAEKNNELLIRNHQSRPTGSKAFHETNAISFDQSEHKTYFQGRGRGRGRGRGFGRGRGGYSNNTPHKVTNYNQKRSRDDWSHENAHKGRNISSLPKVTESTCFRCGSKGHWSKVCRVSEHLCKLYQESINGKEKEVNFVDQNPMIGYTHLDASDFDDDFIQTIDEPSEKNKEVNLTGQNHTNDLSQYEAINLNDDFTNTEFDFSEQGIGGN